MVPYEQKLGNTGISFEMIPVPGGRVTVGSPETEAGRRTDEGPTLEVELEPFWIGKTEVTWGEFQGFMQSYVVFKKLAANRIRQVTSLNHTDAVTVPTLLYDEGHHKEYGDDPKHPAVTMTQYSAKQYTKWLSGVTGVQYRLPTEAEWEHAARAGSQLAYCFGDNQTIWKNMQSTPNPVAAWLQPRNRMPLGSMTCTAMLGMDHRVVLPRWLRRPVRQILRRLCRDAVGENAQLAMCTRWMLERWA